MPYIITTRIDVHGDELSMDVASRTAVATPDEARDHVHSLGADYGIMAHLDCVLDGTSRMPIGPLPDGTVIEVQRVSTGELNRATPEDRRDNPHRRPWEDRVQAVIAAFNAA